MPLGHEHDGMIAYAPCWACRRGFTFHPDLVPSVPIDPVTNSPPDLGGDARRAVLQPVCASCVALANEERRAMGREQIIVPEGAYL